MKKYVINNIFLILCSLLFLFWIIFQIVNPKSLSTGDTGALFLYSKLIAEEFSVLSPNYYYPTELRFLWSSTFYAPLFYIFNDYDYVRLTANIIMYVLLLLSFIYILKQYNIESKYAFLSMILFFIPISNHYLYISIISSFYPVYYILYIMYFALLLKIVDTSSKKWLYIAIYSLLIFIASLNGIRILIYIFVPLLCASILLFLVYKIIYKKDIKASLSYIIYSFVGLMVSLIGYLINDIFLRNMVNFYDYTQGKLYSFIITAKHIDKFVLHFKQAFSIYYWNDLISIISNLSLYILIILFFYMMYYIVRNNKDIKINFIVIFFVVLLIEQICMEIFFRDYKPRYLYTVTIFIPVIIAIYACISKESRKQKILLLIFVILLLFHGSAVLYNTFSADYKAKQKYAIYTPTPKAAFEPVIKYLKENNITFGYGYHTEAHLLDELTNGAIEGGSVKVIKCQFYKMKWDTLVKYFDNTDLHQQVYFILTNKVNDYCKDKNTLLKEHNHQYKDKNYTVYILEKGEILKNLK